MPIREQKANDERNFITKAVNWSLRQIGKLNVFLNKLGIENAEEIALKLTPSIPRYPRLN